MQTPRSRPQPSSQTTYIEGRSPKKRGRRPWRSIYTRPSMAVVTFRSDYGEVQIELVP